MENFDITVNYVVQGWTGDIWAWGILAFGVFLLVVSGSFAVNGESDASIGVFLIACLTLITGGVWMAIQDASYDGEIRRGVVAAREAALTELGFTDILVDTDAYALTRDGNTALYTVTRQGDVETYHQITE